MNCRRLKTQGIASSHGSAALRSLSLSLSRRMTVWLSTAPTEPLTHWYQVRCLLQSPLFTKAGDTLSGTAMLVANKRYDAWAEAADFGRLRNSSAVKH